MKKSGFVKATLKPQEGIRYSRSNSGDLISTKIEALFETIINWN